MKTTIETKLSVSNNGYVEIYQINEYHDSNYIILEESEIEELLEKLLELAKLKQQSEMFYTNPDNTKNGNMERNG